MNNIENFLSNIVVLDTETTGVDDSADIIEFSSSFPMGSNEVLGGISNYTVRFKPLTPCPPEASAIHFITNEDLEECGSYADSIELINELMMTRRFFVAHNASFDRLKMIENHKRHNSPLPDELQDEDAWICTLRFAKKMFSEDMDYKNFTLSYLWFKYELYKECEGKIQPHSAEDDVFMCYKVLEKLLALAVESGIIDPSYDIGSQIVEYCNRPTEFTVMPFGKHKGMPMNELPLNYMEWMVEKSDILNEEHPTFDRDLAFTFEQEFARRFDL